MKVEIDASSFERFADEMAKKYPPEALEAAEPALLEMADYLLGTIPEYPAETKDRLLPPDGVAWLHTDKMRRWFFAAVKSGEVRGWKWIDGHPEKVGGGRSGNLGRAQGREVVYESDDSVSVVMGFDATLAPYAPWVVGIDYPGEEVSGEMMYQARIHQERWWQFGSIITENIDEGWELFGAVFWAEFSNRVQE